MDWKYKHFHQERLFPQSPDIVAEAARAIMTESLGWQVTDTAEGFTAQDFTGKGSSFAHGAIADFHFQSAAGGTLVNVELLVARAGAAGFMLFDVGGYYNIQIRKWLDGIQSRLHAQSLGQEPPPHQPLPPQKKSAACLFHGCLGFIFVMFSLWVLNHFDLRTSLGLSPDICICWEEAALSS